jgi:hypothetical protein
MDERNVQTMLSELADTEAPPARVDIGRAMTRGRRDRRLRIAGAGGSTLAVAAVLGAVVTMVAVPGPRAAVVPGSGSPASSATSGPGSVAVAPKQFDPLVPYASFGWLPAGSAIGGEGAGSELSTDTQSVSLSAGYRTSGATWFSLEVYAEGVCVRSGTATLPVLTCNTRDAGGPGERASSRAPDVDGRPAFWAADAAQGGSLFWEYAPDAWATLYVPSHTQAPPAASERTMLLRVAANVRYADTTPLSFPFWVAGLPANWQVSGAEFTESSSGALLDGTLGLGPAADPDALGLDIQPTYPASSCKFIAGQSSYQTLDGTRVTLRVISEAGNGYESVCGADVRGYLVDNGLETTMPDSNAPVPGEAGLGGVLGISQRIHLLGTDPSGWTTDPIR